MNDDVVPVHPGASTAADKNVKVPAWLNDPTMYHNRGDSTFAGENSEYGDFFGLDDLWTERPEVVRGHDEDLRATGSRDTGIDGYRLDTVKHIDLDFWPQFSRGHRRRPRGQAGKKDFFMFGEVYSADQEVESTYVRRGGLPATLDFSFQEAASGFAADGGSAAGARRRVRQGRPLHRPRHQRGPAADLPRQPRHGPDRLVHRGRAAPTRPPTCAATSSPTS